LAGNISQALAHFELLIRWVYPGLLLWAILPFALATNEKGFSQLPHNDFYVGLGPLEQAGLIIVAGFILYLIERMIVHELGLSWAVFFSWKEVGSTRNFRDPDNRKYPWATGRLLWRRFGNRPWDARKSGTDAEARFDHYLANRVAWVHALGSTWIGAGGVYVLGLVRESSLIRALGFGYDILVIFGLASFVVAWAMHSLIVARAEQDHYVP